MHDLRRSTRWAGALTLLLMGCPGTPGPDGDTDATTGASSGAAGACEPGQELPCACTDGSMSTQVCMADGSGFDACQCTAGEDTSSGMGGTSASTSGDSSGGADGATTTGATSEATTAEGCVPGMASACDGCPDGPGVQVCNDQGELSPCECCEGVHPEVEGNMRFCLRGSCYCGDLQAKPPVDVCFGQVIADVCCPGDIVLECY